MLHPILNKRQNFITYSIIWIIVGIIHALIVSATYDVDISISATESVVFNFLYAVLGIGIWYPVYFTDLEKNKIANFITNHLASASLAVGIWLWLGIVIIKSVYNDVPGYINQLTISTPLRALTGFLIYAITASIYYLFIYYQNFKNKLLRESELKALVKESELNSLKSQINPHFLFNSLNSISSLTMISPEKAQDMVINLSDFLRYSLSHKNESLTTFDKELKNIDRYLKIEKIRFGKRLNVEKDIMEHCVNYYLPGLILQPLMENAVKYGVYESIEQSNISISAKCTTDLLEVHIANEYDPDVISKKGEGIGLRNVSGRMKIQYGREDLLKIEKNDKIFEVILFFPQNDL
ncbi:MAG: histidine kinase [Bacteroidales bacterium]|nr:histidine kinase [Bacteroidales bacterium]